LRGCDMCVHSSTPLLVFIGGSHPEFAAHLCRTDLSKQQGGTTWQSWGGGAHGTGRPWPAWQWPHRPSPLVHVFLPEPTCHWHGYGLLSYRFLALVGHLFHILTRVASWFAGALCPRLNHTIILQNQLEITYTHSRTSPVEFVSK